MTPHEITIVGKDGTEVVIPPSGKEARIKVYQKEVDVVILRGNRVVPIVKTELGEVEGYEFPHLCMNCELLACCPLVNEDVKDCSRQIPKQYYIVSSMVSQKLKRADVLSPDTSPTGVVRDEKGRIIGVKRFQRW